MNTRPPSLQNRLLLLVLGVVMVVWLVTAWITWFDVRHELDELLDGHLAQAASILVVRQAQEGDDPAQGLDAPALHDYAPKVAFQIFHQGHLVLRSANAPTTPLAGARQQWATGFFTVQVDGAAWRVFATYGAEQDVQVYVGEEQASREAIFWAAMRGTLLPMALALPLMALALWWAIRHSMLPLRRFGQTLDQRQPHALHPLALPEASAEMVPMVDALNGLFARIATLLESERRFTADASHELRTPIAAIRAQAQVALGATDDAVRSHALQGTVVGCDRATHLVEQLLTLSRLEATAPAALSELDLAALAREVIADVATRAFDKGQTLEFEGKTACTLRGNRALLSVLVRNLVDNAVRYSPPHARIRVSVLAHQGQSALCVEDSGPGLSEADLARLGERFFRVPGNPEDGSGLGWSIVRRIAAVHHFTLQVQRSADLGGLSVQVLATA